MSTHFFLSHAFCSPKPPFVCLFYYSLLFPCLIPIVTCQLWEINPTYANSIAFYNDANRFDFPLDIKFPCIFNSVGNKTSCSSEELDIYSQPYLHRNSTAPVVYAGSDSVNQQMIWINFSEVIMLLNTNMSLRYDMLSNLSDYFSFIKEDREPSINLYVVSLPASSLRNLHVFESYNMNLSHFRLRKAYSEQMCAQWMAFTGRPIIYLLSKDKPKAYSEQMCSQWMAFTGRPIIYLLSKDKPKLTDRFRYFEILKSEPDAAVLLGSPQQQYSQRSDTSKTSEKAIVKVGAILGFFVLITGVSLCLVIQMKNQTKAIPITSLSVSKSGDIEGRVLPKMYSYQVLASATSNFARNRLLGQGATGCVYKGFLSESSHPIAVKRFQLHYQHAQEAWNTELRIMCRLECRNLVPLIGWSNDGDEFFLVYHYMQNGSLDKHLFGNNGTLLSWELRHDIVLGLASALIYLHEECDPCILHRDIKSANILLDVNFSTKLGDFGVAKILDAESSPGNTKVVGTMGYIAPEYYYEGKASKESDIYSFGIVALEIASGRRKHKDEDSYLSLVQWVWELYGAGKILEAADERLNMDFNWQEMECLLILGLWCAHPVDKQRPSARTAVQVLKYELPLPNLPKEMPTHRYSLPPPPPPPPHFHSHSPSITSSLEIGR